MRKYRMVYLNNDELPERAIIEDNVMKIDFVTYSKRGNHWTIDDDETIAENIIKEMRNKNINDNLIYEKTQFLINVIRKGKVIKDKLLKLLDDTTGTEANRIS